MMMVCVERRSQKGWNILAYWCWMLRYVVFYVYGTTILLLFYFNVYDCSLTFSCDMQWNLLMKPRSAHKIVKLVSHSAVVGASFNDHECIFKYWSLQLTFLVHWLTATINNSWWRSRCTCRSHQCRLSTPSMERQTYLQVLYLLWDLHILHVQFPVSLQLRRYGNDQLYGTLVLEQYVNIHFLKGPIQVYLFSMALVPKLLLMLPIIAVQ